MALKSVATAGVAGETALRAGVSPHPRLGHRRRPRQRRPAAERDRAGGAVRHLAPGHPPGAQSAQGRRGDRRALGSRQLRARPRRRRRARRIWPRWPASRRVRHSFAALRQALEGDAAAAAAFPSARRRARRGPGARWSTWRPRCGPGRSGRSRISRSTSPSPSGVAEPAVRAGPAQHLGARWSSPISLARSMGADPPGGAAADGAGRARRDLRRYRGGSTGPGARRDARAHLANSCRRLFLGPGAVDDA